MAPTFDGNDGNDGNAGNAGGGNAGVGGAGGWFFADRVDLPFISTNGQGDVPVRDNRTDIARFPLRNWTAEWYAWLVISQYVQARDDAGKGWLDFQLKHWTDWGYQGGLQGEIDDLCTAAQDERADALGEIVDQSDEFASYFMNLLTSQPGAYPATAKLLTIAMQVGTLTVMYYKRQFSRPRPTQLCPALLPPLVVPGHASYPSGHSTQAHLIAHVIDDILSGLPQHDPVMADVRVLADRIARNREIAGFHYPTDTMAGVQLAGLIHPLLAQSPPAPAQFWYGIALAAARAEWDPANPANQ
jgi:hypothetical protein